MRDAAHCGTKSRSSSRSISSPPALRRIETPRFYSGWQSTRFSRPGFTKATVSAWRVSLEARGLGSSSIIIRMSAIRKLATEAADNGLLAPELAAGIATAKLSKKNPANSSGKQSSSQPTL